MEELERTEQGQGEELVRAGVEIAEALWHLNDCLASIKEELAASQEAMAENA